MLYFSFFSEIICYHNFFFVKLFKNIFGELYMTKTPRKKSGKPQFYICELCDYKCSHKGDFNKHLSTAKHQMATKWQHLLPLFTKNNQQYFKCPYCDYTCSRQSELTKHLQTNISCCHHVAKIPRNNLKNSPHDNQSIKPTSNTSKTENMVTIPENMICHCFRKYSHRSSFFKHKQKCYYFINNIYKYEINDTTKHTNINDKDEVIVELLKENKKLQNNIVDMMVKGNGTHVTNNNTINNKTFNLQIFLNEECKDAMNLTDFINNIKLQISDIDRIGIDGYTNGISNIIVKELKSIDISQRPIHCSDTKRETIYVKDDNKWEKDFERQKLDKMINTVENKNLHMIEKWKQANPSYNDYNSKTNDEYNQIIMNTMDSSKENKDKVIRNIAKEVKIDK